jgi:hypothetical protein
MLLKQPATALKETGSSLRATAQQPSVPLSTASRHLYVSVLTTRTSALGAGCWGDVEIVS